MCGEIGRAAAAERAAGGGIEDAFVTKINANGNGLVYSTYIGGNSIDVGTGIAVDASGSAYITGIYQFVVDPKDPFPAGFYLGKIDKLYGFGFRS